ncbi:unnamed protein product [Citrullus colocynthis]|uniref:Uncharacterized protein n=1 Tax=Citrullus colocynthis TaxID=252529 RepID=A0ABP0YH58_9ROSI
MLCQVQRYAQRKVKQIDPKIRFPSQPVVFVFNARVSPIHLLPISSTKQRHLSALRRSPPTILAAPLPCLSAAEFLDSFLELRSSTC